MTKQVELANAFHRQPRAPVVTPLHVPSGAATRDEAIAALAYAKYEARGCVHGFDREDWEAASRELATRGA